MLTYLVNIEHSDPKIAINLKPLCLEEFSFYWFESLQKHFHCAQLYFCKFSVHFGLLSLKCSIGKYWILANRSALYKCTSAVVKLNVSKRVHIIVKIVLHSAWKYGSNQYLHSKMKEYRSYFHDTSFDILKANYLSKPLNFLSQLFSFAQCTLFKLSKKNKRTGQKSSPISVQVYFFQKICKFTPACEQILLRILIWQACQ